MLYHDLHLAKGRIRITQACVSFRVPQPSRHRTIVRFTDTDKSMDSLIERDAKWIRLVLIDLSVYS